MRVPRQSLPNRLWEWSVLRGSLFWVAVKRDLVPACGEMSLGRLGPATASCRSVCDNPLPLVADSLEHNRSTDN